MREENAFRFIKLLNLLSVDTFWKYMCMLRSCDKKLQATILKAVSYLTSLFLVCLILRLMIIWIIVFFGQCFVVMLKLRFNFRGTASEKIFDRQFQGSMINYTSGWAMYTERHQGDVLPLWNYILVVLEANLKSCDTCQTIHHLSWCNGEKNLNSKYLLNRYDYTEFRNRANDNRTSFLVALEFIYLLSRNSGESRILDGS